MSSREIAGRRLKWHMHRVSVAALLSVAAILFPGAATTAPAQNIPPFRMPASTENAPQEAGAADAQAELRTGSELTRQGFLQQAIPDLLAAQRAGLDPYAAGVNLGICYLGTEQYQQAISALQQLDTPVWRTATVDNLLSQAYIANGQPEEAFQAFLRAAAFDPKDEKLYDYLADACTDRKEYELGLRIVNRGLTQLPQSARLHYEKAVFLAELGSFGRARPEFDRAAQLAPGSYIGYLAQVQEDLYEGELSAADKVLHQAIQSGHRDYRILSLLGTVLLHEGVVPGQPGFAEAQAALEESARERPNYPSTQIALGRIFLIQGDARRAVTHLEISRRLQPENPAVYASLADAYEMLGDRARSRALRGQMGRLLAEEQRKPSPEDTEPHR